MLRLLWGLARRGWRSAVAFAAYAIVTLLFNWPLPLQLSDRLTGTIDGDTGVYVWNLWVFRHEALVHHRFPLFTSEILSLSPPANLSLHNYTLFADIVALPLIPWIGVIGAFNVVYLLFVTLTAWGMYELARAVVGRDAEAWLAGLLFGFSPVLMARATAHFSLSAAAPLPLFLLAFRRADRDGDPRFGALAGVLAAWAAMWDAYYGIFCVVIAVCYLLVRHVRLHDAPASRRSASTWTVDALLATSLVAIAAILLSGATSLDVLGGHLRLRPLYNPVFAATLLAVVRWWLRHRPTVTLAPESVRRAIPVLSAAAVGGIVVLLPLLIAFGVGLSDGAEIHGPLYWRSSPPGIDLLSLVLPNPNHPWTGDAVRQWLAQLPNGYPENAASIPFVSLLVVAVAVVWFRFRPSRTWLGLTVALAAIAMGPFVRIAGIDTHVPGPWALLRYVPVLTATRTPTRYAIPLMMTFSVLFALALGSITVRRPRYRPVILAVVGLALAFELSPFPRPLYPARVPEAYRIIALDRRDVRVLQLPFGFRSGEWSEGNYSAASQFYQTVHQKPLIGGYLSRIGPEMLKRQMQPTTVRRLAQLSSGQTLTEAEIAELKERAPAFIARAKVGYVVIDRSQTPDPFQRLVTDAYKLVRIASDDQFDLYVPTVAPPLDARAPF